jgi:hypothetical protein
MDAARPQGGFAIGRPHARSFFFPSMTQPAPAPEIDPVALTILAVNRLGPATMRTATNGRSVCITVPDEQVGEIFRSALAEMQKARRTDRLVEIVIAHD